MKYYFRMQKLMAFFVIVLFLFNGMLFAQWSDEPQKNLAVNADPGEKMNLNMYSDGFGGAIVIWLNHNQLQGLWNICAQKLNDNGDLMWGKAARQLYSTNNECSNLQIYAFQNNEILLVWLEKISARTHIMALKINTTDGETLWDNAIYPDSSNSIQKNPRVSSYEQTDGYIFVWEDYEESTSNSHVFAQRISDNGNRLWGPAGAQIYSSENNQTSPAVITSGSSGYIYWQENFSDHTLIFYAKINSNGVIAMPADTLLKPEAGHYQTTPLAIHVNFYILKVWVEKWTPKISYYSKATAVKYLNSRFFNISPNLSNVFNYQNQYNSRIYLSLISDNDNGALCCWQFETTSMIFGGSSDIYIQKIQGIQDPSSLNRFETVWDSGGIKINKNGRDGYDPSIWDDGFGGAFVGWKEISDEGHLILLQKITADGNFSWDTTGVIVSTPSELNEGKYSPKVINDNAEGAILAWIDNKNGHSAVFAQRILSDGSLLKGQKIEVKYPNGGEKLYANAVQEIRWILDNYKKPFVKIEFSPDSGASWETIYQYADTNGTVSWTPNFADTSSQCLIKISDPDVGIPFDISDSTFSIVAQILKIISPGSGEELLAQSKYQISWISENFDDNVKIEYSTNGESGNWKTIAANTANDGSYLWDVPNEPSNNCLIRISDASDNDPSAKSATFKIVVAQQLTLLSPNGGEIWKTLTQNPISWNSSGNIQNVRLELSRSESSDWQIIIDNTENDQTENWLTRGKSSSKCRIKISDFNNLQIFDLSDTYFEISSAIKADTSQPLKIGNQQKDYQIISIPLLLESPSPSAVLFDDFGAYDKKKWRLFDFDANLNKFREFPNTGNFEPGKGFFLIINEANNNKITTGAGNLISIIEYAIPLYPKWNLVGNPYPTALKTEQMKLQNKNDVVDSIYIFDGGWTFANIIKSWQGFAIYNDSEQLDSLIFLFEKTPNTSRNMKQDYSPEKNWKIRLRADCGYSSDFNNYFGVSENARKGKDRYDKVEPPAFGNYISAYAYHPEWKGSAHKFTTDVRSPSEDEYNWTIQIATNMNDKVTLCFDIDEVPAHLEIWLYDNFAKILQNIREKNIFEFAARRDAGSKNLKLIVGKSEHIQNQLGSLTKIPESFKLFQNFPNPFNPSTTIRYGLPKEEKVTLIIYNIAGEEITTLIKNEIQSKGYHTAVWDGRNSSGKIVSNGIYFYRLISKNFSQANKMIFMK